MYKDKNISEREQFFSKMNHDLRGSFTSILGFSDILNDPNEKLTYEEISEYVSRVGIQTKESYELLINFINWLKLDTYKYGLAKEELNLLDVLLQSKSYHKSSFVQNKIEVKLNVDIKHQILLDYEIATSIFNNVFLFLTRIAMNNSVIRINSNSVEAPSAIQLEIITNFENNDFSFLENINLKNLNSNISFPIIFAIKFTELSGGSFDILNEADKTLRLLINLPNK